MNDDAPTAPITPVILSGGVGSRLWPLSRKGYPKQFLPLAGPLTMIQETVRRSTGAGFAAPLVVCNDDHRFLVVEQLHALGVSPEAILLEPVGCNTAPAAAAAALHLLRFREDALMLVMPSDHVIQDVAAFQAAVETAAAAARTSRLVTFGITPSRPETGFGYILAGGEIGSDGVLPVERFVEKPDLDTARAYLADGRYLWNSGIFLFSARVYLEELERTSPDIVAACGAAMHAGRWDNTFFRLGSEEFAASPSNSIDYAVMEKTDRAAMVPVDMGWNDVGAWSALWDIGTKDEVGNVCQGDVILHDTRDCYVRSESGLVALSGICDAVVIATDDAVLVTTRDKAQNVKIIVDRLKAQSRDEHNLHTTVHRPWGNYRGIDRGDRFQVKRIVVLPGERLSFQKHYHRAEHWLVVEGVANVTRGDQTFMLSENESTFIRPGEIHRLENPGKVPLHLIEVQSGSYLGEDDIIRFDDAYGRKDD
jgi:mannose-1-phosphate guanylyltransferase/mannose-6-phosphate isomerase